MPAKRHADSSPSKNILIVVTLLIVAAMVLGGIYYYNTKYAETSTKSAPQNTVPPSPSASPSPLLTATPPVPEAAIHSGTLPLPQPGAFSFVAVDVGQGDAFLIVSPSGKVMLVDAGEEYSVIHQYLSKTGIGKIDVLIATHPHSDHIGGMIKIVRNYAIGSVYMPKAIHDTPTHEALLNAVSAKGMKINTALAKESAQPIEFDENVTVKVLAPISEKYDAINNYSVALHISYGDTSFLLTGDAELESLNQITKKYGALLDCDVLKAGHHGSSDAISDAFLKLTRPRYAVISCAAQNDYGHPHRETLSLLRKYKVKALGTYELGTIMITSDGSALEIFTEN